MGIQLNGSSGADIISSSDGTLTIDGTSTVSTPIVTNTITISDKISHTGDSNTHIRFAGDDTVTVETAGSEAIRVNSSQNFGVGTVSPTARLDVRRDDADGKIAEFHQSTGYGIDIGSSQALAYISSGYNQDWAFKTDQGSGQVERLRITTTGDVNIGAAADNTAIHASGIFNGATPKFEIKLGGAANSYKRLINITNPGGQTGSESLGRVGIKLSLGSEASSGESNKSGAIYAESTSTYNNATALCFATSNTERLRIQSDGKIGIGTNTVTDSNVFVEVVGNASQKARLQFDIKPPQGTNDGEIGSILFRNNTDSVGYIVCKRESAVDDAYLSLGTQATGAGILERLRIDSGGSVTIGDAGTHTYSAHAEGDDLVVGGAGWRGMTIYGEGGGGVIQFADNADNRVGQILYVHSSNEMKFRTNGNADRFEIASGGDVTITDGNLKVASGHGIDFAATGGPTNGTGTSELLDDYEEGDINLTLQGQYGGSISYSYRVGRYIKIGSLVHLTGDIRLNGSWSGNSGNVYIELPFTSYSSGGTVGNGIVAEWNLGNSNWDSLMLQVDNNAANARITSHSGSNNNTSHLQTGELGNGRYLKFGVTYHTHL